MPDSRTLHVGNGSQTQFSVSFPFLSRTHVGVTVGGVTTAFTWVDDSNIDISPAPASSAAIVVQRTTPDGLVSFNDGSALTEDDLNTSVLAAQYQTEEADDQRSSDVATLSLGLLTAEGDIDALESVTGDGTTGNAALGTRMLNAEGNITTLLAVNADRFAVRGTGVAQTYTAGDPQADIVFNATAAVDPDAGWDGVSECSIPSTGLWHFTAIVAHDGGVTVGDAFRIDLNFSDGQVVRTIYTVPYAGANTVSVSGTVYLAAGVDARVRIVDVAGTTGFFRTSTAVNDMTFNAFRVGD